jgi:hypothetical protein
MDAHAALFGNCSVALIRVAASILKKARGAVSVNFRWPRSTVAKLAPELDRAIKGVLIYFGYPEAHEDDAERAARAGLAVIDAVQTKRRGSNAAIGLPSRSRVGRLSTQSAFRHEEHHLRDVPIANSFHHHLPGFTELN